MGRLAIIPARGGSKRIPKKNIKPFIGKPIISYAIKAALDSNLFDEVMVSTDDQEIAEISTSFGAKVPVLRSKKNSDDFATTIDVIKEVVKYYEKNSRIFHYVCCIYPTAPFVTKGLLIKGFNTLKAKDYDCVFPVIKFGFPIQRGLSITNEDHIKILSPDSINKRSQDLESTYHDSGQFYWVNTSRFLDKEKLWTDNTGCIEVSELQAQDIDTETDWKIAELKYKLMIGEK